MDTVRTLVRTPVSSAVAMLSLALGIGANDAAASFASELVESARRRPAALGAARLFKSLLFAVDPLDPLTIALAILVLFAAGSLAGFLPARRAASVEPTLALRSE